MGGFRQENTSAYSILHRFGQQHLPSCPLCGQEVEAWLVREEWRLLGNQCYFKCPHCDTVLRAAKDDITGLAFTPHTMAGQLKKAKGKKLNAVYVTFEKVGMSVKDSKTMLLEREEFILEDIYSIGKF